MKKAIVIGASSGIGRELSRVLSRNGYIVGIVARREEFLLELQKELNTNSYVKRVDISRTEEATSLMEELINDINGVDLIVINAGYGIINSRKLGTHPLFLDINCSRSVKSHHTEDNGG